MEGFALQQVFHHRLYLRFSFPDQLSHKAVGSCKYEEVFGFTEKEVFAAMDEFGLTEKEEVRAWYDGFTFGETPDTSFPRLSNIVFSTRR